MSQYRSPSSQSRSFSVDVTNLPLRTASPLISPNLVRQMRIPSVDPDFMFQNFIGIQSDAHVVFNTSEPGAHDVHVVPQNDFLKAPTRLSRRMDTSNRTERSTNSLHVPRSATSPHMRSRSLGNYPYGSPTSTSACASADEDSDDDKMRMPPAIYCISNPNSDDENGTLNMPIARATSFTKDVTTSAASSSNLTCGAEATTAQRKHVLLPRAGTPLDSASLSTVQDMMSEILQGSMSNTSKRGIGVMFQNIRVTPNAIHELMIACSFRQVSHIHMDAPSSSPTVNRSASHSGIPNDTPHAPLHFHHAGKPRCRVRLADMISKWRHEVPCVISDTHPNLYAHCLIPRNVLHLSVEILFDETSIFHKKETMLIVHTNACFLREITGATNVEKSWNLKSPLRVSHPAKQCVKSRWSTLHNIADEVYIIHEQHVSVADSEHLRWEMMRSGISYEYHDAPSDEVSDNDGIRSALDMGEVSHLDTCETCFMLESWVQQQRMATRFNEFTNSDDNQISSCTSQLQASILPSNNSFVVSPESTPRSVSRLGIKAAHTTWRVMDSMKRYIDVLTCITSKMDEENEAPLDQSVLIMTDSVIIRKDIDDQLMSNALKDTEKTWDILLLGSYWWENKMNPTDNPLITDLHGILRNTDAQRHIMQARRASSPLLARSTNAYGSSSPTHRAIARENPQWHLDVLQPAGFSCPYSTFAMVLRTRAIQISVLEIFKSSYAQRTNVFPIFHLWMNSKYGATSFVCVPNLFAMHPHYDDLRVSISSSTDAHVASLSVSTDTNAGTVPHGPTCKRSTYSFRNYEKDHSMYWNMEMYSHIINKKFIPASFVLSSLASPPLDAPKVHAYIFIDENSGAFEKHMVASLFSMHVQTTPHTRTTVFHTDAQRIRVMNAISQHPSLARSLCSGEIQLIVAKSMGVYNKTVRACTDSILKSVHNQCAIYLLILDLGVLSLPQRVEKLLECARHKQQHQRRRSRRLFSHLVAVESQITDGRCRNATVYETSLFMRMRDFSNTFLLKSSNTSTVKGVTFVNTLHDWIKMQSGHVEYIQKILAYKSF